MVEEEDKHELNSENRVVAPWATGENLRQVETKILIPNLMRKKAKVVCKDVVENFEACVKGRSLSLAWACGKEVEAMKKCLQAQMDSRELHEEATQEYLKSRENFQNHYAKTGIKSNQQRKESTMH